MASNLDLIINLVVKNQDSIKSIGRDLKALEAAKDLSSIVVPELKIPELTIANLLKFGKQINDVAPIAVEISQALGPILIDGLIDATDQLARMAQIASDIGSVSIEATFDPSGSVEKSFARARNSAEGLSQEVGDRLSNSAKESERSIDAVAESLSRVKELGPIETPGPQRLQPITFAPETLDETIALFDAIKATYSITTQLNSALDKAGGSRSGQINAIAQALTGVTKLVEDIYGFSVGLNDKEFKAIATSIVGIVQPLKDAGKAAVSFKDSILMAGLDPAQWVKPYEKAVKDLGGVLGGVGKVAIDLKRNLTSADGDASTILKLVDLKELQSGLGSATRKVSDFKKSFDLKDLPGTILSTAKAADELARSVQAISKGENIFAGQGGNKALEALKKTIAQVAEKYKELQGVKLPPLQSKEAVQLAQALGTTSDKAKKLQQDLNLQPQAIVNALNELNRFASVNLPLREQFKILNTEMGVTRQQFLKLKDIQSGGVEKSTPKLPAQLEPISSRAIDFGLKKIDSDAQILAQTFGIVSAKLQEIKAATTFKPLPINEAVAFAQSLGVTAAQARSLQKDLNLPTGTITSALNSIKQFESVKLPLKEQFSALNAELGITRQQFDQIKKIKDIEPEDKTGLGLKKTFDSVSKVAFAYNNIETAIRSMVAKVNPAYAAMIGANEQLNQQLLKSAATITATSAVSGADGAKLGNLESIRALQPQLKSTIREVEIATQSLVGVTSQQTSEVFNVILTNTGQLNGQLKSATDQAEKFKNPLDAAAKLAPGMVATLGTLGLPLSQASDEIGNLLKGEIDQTAQVAKSLGITRQMVDTWKAQGTLVDQLTKRFDPFLKANAEAARSVSGISSNIQDLFEITNREAGKPVADLYVDALDSVYKYLQGVMPKVQEVFVSIIQQQVATIKTIAGSLKPLFDGVMTAVTALAPTIEPIIRSSLGLVVALFKTLEPVFSAVGQIIGAVGKALAAMVPFLIQANAIFGVLASTTFNIGIALNGLAIPLQIIVAGITAIAGAIESIAKDPLGGILIQAIGLTVVLAPLVNTLLSLSATVAALGGFFAWLPGAIAGFQTLVIVASSFLPFGGAISAALAKATLAVNGFFAAVIAGAKPPLLIEFVKGAIVEIGLMAKSFFLQAIPATIALAKELGTFALTIIPRVVAGFAAMKTGGIAAGFAALTAGLPMLSAGFAGLAGATNLAAAAATKLLMAYGPLLVVVAAVGATLLAKSAKDLADVNQELEDVSKTNNAISDTALKTAQKLKALKELPPSKTRSEELKNELFAAKQQIGLIEDQIAANKKLREDSQKRGANESQLNAFDALIKEKEREKEMLSKLANEVKIASQPLAELGTSSEQMAQKVRSATRLLEAGVGDPQKYSAAAKELTGLLQKQVELGQVTANEAAKQLLTLQNNTKLDYESQLAAKEAIVKIYQSRFAKIEELQSAGKLSNSEAERELEQVQQNGDLELKTRQEAGKKIIALKKEVLDAELAESAAATAKIEAQKAQGAIGEAEAARQTSDIKVKESQKRLELQRKEAELETNPEIKRKLVAEVAKTEAEISKIKADEINRRNAERLKDFDEEEKLNQAKLETGKVSEEAFNAEKRSIDQRKAAEEIAQLTEKLGKLKSTDKEGREAINAQIAEAESKREQALKAANDREIATLQNRLDRELALVRAAEAEKNLEIARSVKDGSKSREQGDIEAAKAAAESAEKAIAAEEEKLDKLRSLPRPNNPKDAEAFDKQIADQQAKSSQARIDLLKKQGEIEKALIAEVAKANQKANDEIEKSQQDATIDRNAKEIEQLKAQGADVESIARATAKQELDRERSAANEKYVLKQEELAKLKALIESGQLSPDQAIEAERKLQKELGDINLQRIDLEKKALEALRAEKVRLIELESQNSTNAVQKKLDILNAQKTVLEQQNALLSAQDRLESASFNLAKQRTGFAIEDAKNAKDETLVKQLETQAAADQLTFTRQQNISKIESIQLSLEQKAIDAAMAALNAEIATIQAQANLQKALAEGKSKEVIEALRREVELRGKQEALTAKAAENQKTIGGKELAAAKIEAQTAEERDTRAYNKAVEASGGRPIATQAATPTRYQPGATAEKVDSKNKAIDKPSADADSSAQRLVEAITQSIKGEGPGPIAAEGKPKTTIGPDGKPVTPPPIVDPLKAEADKKTIEANNALNKATTDAANAVSKFTGALKPIPARFAGGPIGAGETFIGAELGPELARHSDGSYQMLMMPGIYNLERSAQIIPAHETQQILQNSAVMMQSSVSAGAIVQMDNRAVVDELRRLRSIVTSRRPQMNVPVTFEAPASDGTDRKMAEFSRMLVRSGL